MIIGNVVPPWGAVRRLLRGSKVKPHLKMKERLPGDCTRTPALPGPGTKTDTLGGVAQVVEQAAHIRCVRGPSPCAAK